MVKMQRKKSGIYTFFAISYLMVAHKMMQGMERAIPVVEPARRSNSIETTKTPEQIRENLAGRKSFTVDDLQSTSPESSTTSTASRTTDANPKVLRNPAVQRQSQATTPQIYQGLFNKGYELKSQVVKDLVKLSPNKGPLAEDFVDLLVENQKLPVEERNANIAIDLSKLDISWRVIDPKDLIKVQQLVTDINTINNWTDLNSTSTLTFDQKIKKVEDRYKEFNRKYPKLNVQEIYTDAIAKLKQQKVDAHATLESSIKYLQEDINALKEESKSAWKDYENNINHYPVAAFESFGDWMEITGTILWKRGALTVKSAKLFVYSCFTASKIPVSPDKQAAVAQQAADLLPSATATNAEKASWIETITNTITQVLQGSLAVSNSGKTN